MSPAAPSYAYHHSLELEVSIDTNSGFCFGVLYAIALAEEHLDNNAYLYCLGDIVHNDMEVERLTAKGLRIIDHEALKDLHDETVLIRAHGEPPSTYRIALENNITLVDASCPVVLKLQHRIQEAHQKGSDILIYGKHNHAEVIGLKGQTGNEAQVVQSKEELADIELPEEITLFSQTTKSVAKFHELKQHLIDSGKKVTAYDTICRQVSNRDSQLVDFAKTYDKIIFVAGTKSSNGKVLFDVCRNANPHTWFVSSPEEVNQDWFDPFDKVGVCGATSTPMWLMEEVSKRIQSF